MEYGHAIYCDRVEWALLKYHLIRTLVLPCRTLDIFSQLLSFSLGERREQSFTEDRKRFLFIGFLWELSLRLRTTTSYFAFFTGLLPCYAYVFCVFLGYTSFGLCSILLPWQSCTSTAHPFYPSTIARHMLLERVLIVVSRRESNKEI